MRKWANACRLNPSRKRGRRKRGMDGEVDKSVEHASGMVEVEQGGEEGGQMHVS